MIGKAQDLVEDQTEPERKGHATHGLSAEPDHVLVSKIADGDHAAFSVLVLRHTDKHLAYAERVMYSRQEAEDAVQEAFIKLWAKANKFDPNTAKFTTWFYRIVLNQCLDRKRRKKPVALPEGFDAIDDRDGPAETLAESQRAKRVKEGVMALPEKQRQALTLCYFQGLSNKEAAEVLDLGIKAMESLLMRGRKALAKNLANKAQDLLNLD